MSAVFYTPAAKCFVSDAWPASATYHRQCGEHCDQRVGRSPQRARPVQISSRSRWFCRSVSVDRLGISPLRLGISPSFSQADLGPTSISAQEIFFRFFRSFFFFFFFVKICALSERYRNLMAGTFEIQAIFGNIAFPLASVSHSCFPSPLFSSNYLTQLSVTPAS